MPRPRILVVDDEPNLMQHHWDALRRLDYEVHSVASSDDAVRAYNTSHYDLAILDRTLPASEILGDDEGLQPPLGEQLYYDMRRRRHLEDMSVILLTNYYDAVEAGRLRQHDDRVVMLHKINSKQTMLEWVREFLALYPVARRDIVIPRDEHPSVTPYFTVEVATGRPVRVYFRPCDPMEFESEHYSWRCGSRFQELTKDRHLQRKTFKLLRHDGLHGEVIGMYFQGTPRGRRRWHDDVLFEAAPWNVRRTNPKCLAGVSRVLAARFVREWLYREEQERMENVGDVAESAAVLRLGMAHFADISGAWDGHEDVDAALTEAGFGRDGATGHHWLLKRESALSLVAQVCRYPF